MSLKSSVLFCSVPALRRQTLCMQNPPETASFRGEVAIFQVLLREGRRESRGGHGPSLEAACAAFSHPPHVASVVGSHLNADSPAVPDWRLAQDFAGGFKKLS